MIWWRLPTLNKTVQVAVTVSYYAVFIHTDRVSEAIPSETVGCTWRAQAVVAPGYIDLDIAEYSKIVGVYLDLL